MSELGVWNEIIQVKKENRHELILSGKEVSKRIDTSGLDTSIFTLEGLNYLNIHQTCLNKVPDDIGKLVNLTTLVLHSNELTELPATIELLSKLKLFDCSRNKLEKLPDELSKLTQLTTIILNSNQLTKVPSLVLNNKLALIDLSNNKFEEFPDINYEEFVHLAEVKVNGNQIKDLPPTISRLSALKLFDVSDNCITVIPGELADCGKLKELNLAGNKLVDKRLYKLVNQCRTKQVLDYVRQHCPKLQQNQKSESGGKKTKKQSKNSENESSDLSTDSLTHKLKVLKVADSTPAIKILKEVASVRPHISGCIVRNLAFNEEKLKKFIQFQSRLHENVCEKRNIATIATHDLDAIAPGDITYTAMPPAEMKFQPLNGKKLYTAEELFKKLQTEADNLRKEKKRNVYSGVYKYLYLIEGKPLYPCLIDSNNQIISFPPITNSEVTKINLNTRNLFIEVTSAISQDVCKKVSDELLKELLIQGYGQQIESNESSGFNNLEVEQMKIVDIDGNLKSIYPSRINLNFHDNNIMVIREN